MRQQPREIFKVLTPDQVAECMNGVYSEPTGLFEALWNLVPRRKPYDVEDNGPADVVGIGALSENWDKLADEHTVKLNELADAQEGMF